MPSTVMDSSRSSLSGHRSESSAVHDPLHLGEKAQRDADWVDPGRVARDEQQRGHGNRVDAVPAGELDDLGERWLWNLPAARAASSRASDAHTSMYSCPISLASCALEQACSYADSKRSSM